MTRTDIYNASKSIFPGLPDEETFATDMTDNEKASRAYQSAVNNKDKYEEMGVTLPETVEEFQAILTTDPKKKSTNTGSNGSSQTQQSSGSKPAQLSQDPDIKRRAKEMGWGDDVQGYIDSNWLTKEHWEKEQAKKNKSSFNGFIPFGVKPKEKEKLEFPGALPESERKAMDVLSQKPTLKFVEDEDLKEEIRKNPKEWTDKLIEKNPSLKDQTIDGVLPGLLEQEPTIENQSSQNLKNANKLVEYTNTYDESFDKMIKQSDAFTESDVKADPKKYQDAVLNDYLEYLKIKNGDSSQTYLNFKERIDYYRSLGDKLYNDETYADDLKRYQDLKKEALDKISNNSYSKSIALENNYDWKYFSQRVSDLDIKARNIEKQIKELGLDQGKSLSLPQQQKYNELINQYNQIKEEFEKLSEETKIDNSVMDEMRNVQQKMSNVKNSIDAINNEEGVNAEIIRNYEKEKAENKKAQEEFYNTKNDGNVEALGKGVTLLGQQAATTFVNGLFDIAKTPEIIGEAFGAKGYGWSDKLSETADNITSMVELYSPQLQSGDFSGFMKFMNTAGQGIGSVMQFYASGSGASKWAKSLGLSEKGLNAANKTAQFVSASSTSTVQLYNELIESRFTPEEASIFAIAGGIVMGTTEMAVPEDELVKNEIKQTIIAAVKSGASPKEAVEKGLNHLALRAIQISGSVGKETLEEGFGSIAESASKQIASTLSDKKIDGIWNLDDFNADAIAGGGGTALIMEIMKFGPRKGTASNPFEENLVGYLAENYDKITKTLAATSPQEYDKIANRFEKLKEIYEGLKNTPSFNKLSKTDQDHVLAQAHAKQVILENIKQSGLSKSAFQEEIDNIDEDIFQTLNGLRSRDTEADKSKKEENAVQKPSTEEVLPREQGATSETGGQPQGMGQSVQGQEVTQEGQEVSQEGVDIEQKKKEVINQPLGELPENTEDFTGVGAGYLKNNLWASKKLGKDSKTSLLGNIKNEVLNKGKKVFLYFIDPKLSEGKLDTDNKYNTKLTEKINAQGNKTLSGAENAAIENEVGAELAQEGVKAELVSDEKDGTYRIFDTKNTDLLGYIEATPELVEKLSDPNISEEEAQKILFDEAGVQMGDNVLIHANENDLSKYKTQKDLEAATVPAGKKLFNEPNPETAQISDEYKKAKGIEEGPGSNITKLDTDRAMKIADAYDQMEDTPNDPEVQKAYQKLADETLDQFNAITDKGYTVELWEGEGEPYANSEEMIKDLKDNKHMYIFSTEQGFGDNPITDEQRKQNKLLEDSKFKDKNGKPLLYNDLFRFVHDFFGHSERGNGFGPVGEENAWDVHARMYTPLARRAMTTETRGQNSWVNFGPQMRNEDGSLKKPSDPGYLKATERRFADQKMGLLPEEFSQIEESSEPQFDKKELSTEYLDALEKSGLTIEDVEAWKEKNRVRQQQAPIPIVRDAAQKLDEGEITSEEFRKVVRDNQPIIPFTKVPELPTVQDIISSLDLGKFKEGSGAGVVGVNKEFKDGDLVATRLDIPAYNNFDTWVVSIHDAKNEGKILGYAQTAVLKNVDFIINPRQSLSIAYQKLNARGEKTAKTTIARMRGSWVNESPESVHERAKKLLNDPQWVQVGMNPYRHSGFYDKKTGEPLVSAEELIQVGALVLAKNPVMTTWDDPMFATKNLKGDIIFFDKNVESDSSDPYTYNEETLVNEMNNSEILNPEIDLETGLDEVGDLDVESIKGRNNLSSTPDVISIAEYNGKPIMLTISDELRVGNVNNPINGKLINKLFGGLLFPWSKGNEGYAWAYTSEKAARDVLSVARQIYKSNKSLYPDGMIPVAVVKMGKDAMVSNEAVLRQIIQNLEDGKIPAKNKAKAYELLKQRIKDDYNKLKEKSKSKDGLSHSEKASLKGHADIISLFNKAKDFDSFLKKSNLLNIGTRPIVIKKITTGSTDIIPTKFTLGKNINSIVSALMEGVDPKELKRFNLGNLVSNLTEPALANVPNRHVISIIEVDAKQKDPIRSATHPNYPYVLKGRGVGVVKDTVHIGRILPAAYGNAVSKLIKNYELKEDAKAAKAASVWSNALPAALNNTLFRNKPVSQAEIEANKLIGWLQLAFPNTQFFTDQETWDAIINDPAVKKYIKNGDVVYGLTKDGKIYLNPSLMNSNTPIHEAGHIWLDVIENLEPELFNKGMKLAEEVAGDLGMSSKTTRDKKEILAKLIGDRGESIVNAAKKSKVKEWLLSLWNFVKSKLQSIRGLTTDQIENLTMNDFLDGALSDILGGEKAFDKKQTSKVKGEPEFSKSSDSVDSAINQLSDAQETGGSEVIKAQKEVAEKLGEEGAKIAEIDRNFDKLADDLGFIKTCII